MCLWVQPSWQRRHGSWDFVGRLAHISAHQETECSKQNQEHTSPSRYNPLSPSHPVSHLCYLHHSQRSHDLPKQSHHLETKCSDTEGFGRCFTSKPKLWSEQDLGSWYCTHSPQTKLYGGQGTMHLDHRTLASWPAAVIGSSITVSLAIRLAQEQPTEFAFGSTEATALLRSLRRSTTGAQEHSTPILSSMKTFLTQPLPGAGFPCPVTGAHTDWWPGLGTRIESSGYVWFAKSISYLIFLAPLSRPRFPQLFSVAVYFYIPWFISIKKCSYKVRGRKTSTDGPAMHLDNSLAGLMSLSFL